MGANRRIQVAVLGGGCGAIAAAFELTKTPALRARYEVTIYQQGWRLGGKGASGRNAKYGQRIQEHGLHAFLGFYENAFTLMREAYAEWVKPPECPFQQWTDAFKPQRQLSLEEELPDGRGGTTWSAWNFTFPTLPGEPGDGGPLKEIGDLLGALLRELDGHSKEAHRRATKEIAVTRPVRSDAFAAMIMRARELVVQAGAIVVDLFDPALAEAHVIVQSLTSVALTNVAGIATTEAPKVLRQLIGEARDSVRAARGVVLARVEGGRGSDEDADEDFWRRLRLVVELGSAIALGIVSDVLPSKEGFDAINDYDFKEWLEWHGAPPDVAWSALTKALYDLGFAYEGGITTREHARAAAGVALRILLSLGLGYKGAPLWKMQAGMGDTVFTPLYEILTKQRDVRVEFFRRVTAIEPSPDGNLVKRIVVARQVALRPGCEPYEPLVPVKNLPCWPAEPRWEFIAGGDEMKEHPERHDFESAWCPEKVGEDTLEYGRDFDLVVLGIAIGALPDVAPKLIAASPRWQKMIAWTRTVPTQAMQLWLTPDLEGLGWKAGTTILTSYAEPFDSWGEMSHLLPREDWKAPDVPRSVEYFCGALADVVPLPPFTDSAFPGAQHAQVKANAIAWLAKNTGALWPAAVLPGPNREPCLDWSKLVDPDGRAGAARFDAQFWRANIDPTERYVLSVPGSLSARLAPGDSDFANLYLAGDWTRTTLNGGCAESAIESGILAARALIKERPR
jgi:uncharacterized protein with NAD-binding domain and iron-sulfur cluster